MSGKQAFDRKVAAIEALRSAPAEAAGPLRRALGDRNNYVVSKAACVAADLNLQDLIPDLLAAYDRCFADPVKSDPQCWAKDAIAKALKQLGHREPSAFLRGFAHVQPEPVWGGFSDSATTLRSTCILALADCALDDLSILACCAEGLADEAKPVRIDTAMAIAQLGRPEGVLLLRLKALSGDTEPEVTGQCFLSLLALDPRASVEFIAKFLYRRDEDARAEAVAALAQAREPEALELLKKFWKCELPPGLRRTLLISLGASPLREAAEFLLHVIETAPRDQADIASTALASSRFAQIRGQAT